MGVWRYGSVGVWECGSAGMFRRLSSAVNRLQFIDLGADAQAADLHFGFGRGEREDDAFGFEVGQPDRVAEFDNG